jgi:D-sedoheptulose 7-phosphate isomerase
MPGDGQPTIVFSGRDGGEAKQLVDFCIVAPSLATGTIQKVHIVLPHTLCECVEIVMCSP